VSGKTLLVVVSTIRQRQWSTVVGRDRSSCDPSFSSIRQEQEGNHAGIQRSRYQQCTFSDLTSVCHANLWFLFQNGFVELREFEKIVQLLKKYDQISQVFEELDTNDDHRISFQEFKKGFHLLNENSDDEDRLKQEFDAINSNDGGSILFDEVDNDQVKNEKIDESSFLISSACTWPRRIYTNELVLEILACLCRHFQ
jgi:hypothetical protein